MAEAAVAACVAHEQVSSAAGPIQINIADFNGNDRIHSFQNAIKFFLPVLLLSFGNNTLFWGYLVSTLQIGKLFEQEMNLLHNVELQFFITNWSILLYPADRRVTVM